MPANLTDYTNDQIADLMSDYSNFLYASACAEHKKRLADAECGSQKGFIQPPPPPIP